MKITSRHAVVVAISLLLPLGAHAYRPFDSTDAAVAAKGEMELEVGPVGYQRSGRQDDLVLPTLVVNWGFLDRWELVLEGKGYLLLGPDAGGARYSVEQADLFAKVVLREGCLQERPGPSIATEFGVLLPSMNAGATGLGAQATVIVSERWPAITLHLNGAVALTREHTLGGFAGLIAEGPDAWPVRPVGEVFVDGASQEATTVSGLAGAIWRAGENLSFDGALRLARTGGAGVLEVRLGFTWSFPVGGS